MAESASADACRTNAYRPPVPFPTGLKHPASSHDNVHLLMRPVCLPQPQAPRRSADHEQKRPDHTFGIRIVEFLGAHRKLMRRRPEALEGGSQGDSAPSTSTALSRELRRQRPEPPRQPTASPWPPTSESQRQLCPATAWNRVRECPLASRSKSGERTRSLRCRTTMRDFEAVRCPGPWTKEQSGTERGTTFTSLQCMMFEPWVEFCGRSDVVPVEHGLADPVA